MLIVCVVCVGERYDEMVSSGWVFECIEGRYVVCKWWIGIFELFRVFEGYVWLCKDYSRMIFFN